MHRQCCSHTSGWFLSRYTSLCGARTPTPEVRWFDYVRPVSRSWLADLISIQNRTEGDVSCIFMSRHENGSYPKGSGRQADSFSSSKSLTHEAMLHLLRRQGDFDGFQQRFCCSVTGQQLDPHERRIISWYPSLGLTRFLLESQRENDAFGPGHGPRTLETSRKRW